MLFLNLDMPYFIAHFCVSLCGDHNLMDLFVKVEVNIGLVVRTCCGRCLL